MNEAHHQHPSVEPHITYKAGVAARMAGLSAETLRVWERRYGVTDAGRSARGHRLYTVEQVRRLGLLKQLVDQGHAIGVVAALSTAQLDEMVAAPLSQHRPAAPIRIAVVGATLQRRIEATVPIMPELHVVAGCKGLDNINSLPEDAATDVVVLELSELDENAIPQILQARQHCRAVAVVVLYRFCSSATIRALRAHGCVAARVPAQISEIENLCRAALSRDHLPAVSSDAAVPPVRFSEEWLSAITLRGNGITCECPRHLADLLMMVGSFERYSAMCASKNNDDAKLHKELECAAGQARHLLEIAMERLARADGLWT